MRIWLLLQWEYPRLIRQFETSATDTILRHFWFPQYFQLNFPCSISGDTLSRISENTLRLWQPCWYPEVVPHSRRGPITCQYRHYWRTERNINVYDPMCVCSILPTELPPSDPSLFYQRLSNMCHLCVVFKHYLTSKSTWICIDPITKISVYHDEKHTDISTDNV